MLEDGAEGKNVLLRGFELARNEEETSERDEDIATPRASPLHRMSWVSLGIRARSEEGKI